MTEKTKIALLYGGKSGEHEVSLSSAAAVITHLNPEKYQIIPIGMDKEGQFFLNDYQELRQFTQQLPVKTALSQPLQSLLINGQFAVDVDVVFPIAHGPLYEDGCLQGLLKLADVAFVGSDVLSSAIGMDKDIMRRLVNQQNLDVSTARYQALSWFSTPTERITFCETVEKLFGWPLFVKPCSLGSSVGIHKVKNQTELLAAVDDALRYDETIIVEEFIRGREIELAVLENSHNPLHPQVSLPGEIRMRDSESFYSYSAKYLEPDAAQLLAPAEVDPKLLSILQRVAADIFICLKCKGMARADFFVNEESGKIYFNEINTVPGFTPISMYPKLWQVSGLAYPDLLDALINLALIHFKCRRSLVTSYQ